MSSNQMHSLEQFLAQAQGPSVSWADVDDDLEMYSTMDKPEVEPEEEIILDSRSSRHAPVMPRAPPFVIYCGNLAYNCTELNLKEFFAPINPIDVRIMIDPKTKKGKGHGYVEFRTRDDMERAFDRNCDLLLNRPIRIDVQTNRGHGHGSSMDRPARMNSMDRGAPRPANTTERSGSRQFAPPAAVPAERPKLVLKPRTVDTSSSAASTPVQKLNPFGAARPREEVLKEKAAASGSVTAADEEKTCAAAAADKLSHSPAKTSINRSVSDRRTHSPVNSRAAAPPAPVSGSSNYSGHQQQQQPQKSAWGPVRSVLPTPPPPPVTESAPVVTPKESRQRFPADSRAGPGPRSKSEQLSAADHHGNESRPFRPTPSHRGAGHQADQGPSNSRPFNAQHTGPDRKGPVRHHDNERKSGPRPHHHNNGPDRQASGPNSEHRGRHRHDDRRESREHPHDQSRAINKPEPGLVSDHNRSQVNPQPSPTNSSRNHSPSHHNPDDTGFEVQQRKGRRNGSNRGGAAGTLSSSMARIDLNTNANNPNNNNNNNNNNNRKEKVTTDKPSRYQVSEIPSSVAYSSNMFSTLVDLSDD